MISLSPPKGDGVEVEGGGEEESALSDRYIITSERVEENHSSLKEGKSEGYEKGRQLKVLLGITGSVATIKALELIQALLNYAKGRSLSLQLRVVATANAARFLVDEEKLPWRILRDEDEWRSWKKRGDPVLHIELRRWADAFLIAPLSANSLAKIANGICDNLVTCVARAWDFTRPFVVFPAMNTLMWEHPITSRQVDILRSFGVKIVPPTEKVLMCGDKGIGAFPPVPDVVAEFYEEVSERLSFLGSE
ncbi:phosphopantothenoylcysteine decarboxylase isoform x1 [Cystoisospora suis]|uniref:Phosphopantothenoylcysteine decarboxylase isoform x1 n=1 Tax=Cystoisospora suis TaxID=483139 RepID=A0A2C6KN59_9APIC|nr:phosphopantothenoylcysteine decarboxylase isoform x1 [Cystoisospora suis]